jgi:hypothetical protein
MKDVKDEKKCKITGMCLPRCSAVVGGIFIILATVLTLLTVNSFGILGMFLVGILLCRHKFGCGCSCHSSCGCACHTGSCHSSSCDEGTDDMDEPPAKTTKKTTKKES